ncbi:LapA family protein [Gordonia humi]|uniref:Putative integral membrane protein n=1 Tax=Gordonia humi TaxID=686429 RepID=A0A840F469_9ACTN|nr:LapA family protein [Gordonia humi]MBB4136686.1 putative integral membrane protein [Gordonia humi]
MSTNASAPSPRKGPSTGQSQTTRDAGTFVKQYWLPIVLVIVAIVFILTNTNRAPLTILWVDINSPLWLTLTVTVLVGFVVGWFVGRRQKK